MRELREAGLSEISGGDGPIIVFGRQDHNYAGDRMAYAMLEMSVRGSAQFGSGERGESAADNETEDDARLVLVNCEGEAVGGRFVSVGATMEYAGVSLSG